MDNAPRLSVTTGKDVDTFFLSGLPDDVKLAVIKCFVGSARVEKILYKQSFFVKMRTFDKVPMKARFRSYPQARQIRLNVQVLRSVEKSRGCA